MPLVSYTPKTTSVRMQIPLYPKKQLLRSNSGKRSKGPSTTGDVDIGMLVGWLREAATRSANSVESLAATRLSAYRDKRWEDVLPQLNVDGLTRRDRLKAGAVWELFTSECSHLSQLSLLCDPFLALIRELKTSDDPRAAVPELRAIDLDKLFMTVETLRDVSVKFAERLESALLGGAEAGDGGPASETSFGEDALRIGPVIEAMAALQLDLLPHEMQFRLKHRVSREYLSTLLTRGGQHVKAFFEWCESDERCGRFGIGDLLLQPLQRLMRYPLLLKAILKQTSDPDEVKLVGNCITALEKAIMVHNSVVEENDSNYKFSRVEMNLRWPTLLDRASKQYIPESIRKVLAKRSEVSLQRQSHLLDVNSSNVVRTFIYEGWFSVVGKRGVEIEKVFSYLVGGILLLTKPVGSEKKGGAIPPAAAAAGFLKTIYQRPYHLRELEVYDIPDDGQLMNSFLLIVLDGFGNPCDFKTIRVGSRFEKADWLKHLKDGICKSHTDAVLGGVQTPTDVSRKVKMAPSRRPLSRQENSDSIRYHRDAPTRHAGEPVRPSPMSPTGFWGLDNLTAGENDEAPSDDDFATATTVKSPVNLRRSASLPKSPPERMEMFEWDDFGTGAGGSNFDHGRAASTENIVTSLPGGRTEWDAVDSGKRATFGDVGDKAAAAARAGRLARVGGSLDTLNFSGDAQSMEDSINSFRSIVALVRSSKSRLTSSKSHKVSASTEAVLADRAISAEPLPTPRPKRCGDEENDTCLTRRRSLPIPLTVVRAPQASAATDTANNSGDVLPTTTADEVGGGTGYGAPSNVCICEPTVRPESSGWVGPGGGCWRGGSSDRCTDERPQR